MSTECLLQKPGVQDVPGHWQTCRVAVETAGDLRCSNVDARLWVTPCLAFLGQVNAAAKLMRERTTRDEAACALVCGAGGATLAAPPT